MRFGKVEKEKFVQYMREYEAFCGVQVMTFCVMTNHFHILLEVPQKPEVLPTDEELLQRVEKLSGRPGSSTTRQQLEQLRATGHHNAAEELRKRFFKRMWDVSAFMKLLKQRFSQWLNKRQGRVGTLWEGRFDSVLVEGAGAPLLTMAAYIDLNPKRAGLVNDPATFRWSGYGEAMAGQALARASLNKLAQLGSDKPEEGSFKKALEVYRVYLFGVGAGNKGLSPEGKPLRKSISRAEVLKVLQNRGKVPINEFLQLRVRYFVDGAVIGSRAFVEELFQKMRGRFGPKRRTGARAINGVEGLFSLRDLQRKPVFA
jgi:REP element-mobilizing transposase RayT